MMTLSIVAIIPCYNVATFCERVVLDTIPFVSHLIVIDDGSTDETGQILHRLEALYREKIHCISFQKNRGKGFALIEGMRYALSHFPNDSVLTLDGDGQHNPTHIPAIIEAIRQGADLAIGTRKFNEMPFRSRFSNTLITFLLRRIYPKAPFDTQSGMRAFSGQLVKKIAQAIPGGRYEMEFRCLLLALAKKLKVVEIPISTIYIEKNRFSQFSPLKDSIRILWILLLHVVKNNIFKIARKESLEGSNRDKEELKREDSGR